MTYIANYFLLQNFRMISLKVRKLVYGLAYFCCPTDTLHLGLQCQKKIMMFDCLSGYAAYDTKTEINHLPVCFCLPRMQVLAECHKHYSCFWLYSIFSSEESYCITLCAKDKMSLRNPQPENENISKQES